MYTCFICICPYTCEFKLIFSNQEASKLNCGGGSLRWVEARDESDSDYSTPTASPETNWDSPEKKDEGVGSA